MFDLKTIRDDPEAFDRGLARRGLPARSPEILALDKAWRESQTRAEQLQAERNKLAREIGAVKAKGGDAADIMRRVAESKDEGTRLEAEAAQRKTEIDALLAGIPNIPLDEVPDGKDEHDNKLVRMHGTPRNFSFAPKDHVALGEGLKQMDFARAGKLSGARFVVLTAAARAARTRARRLHARSAYARIRLHRSGAAAVGARRDRSTAPVSCRNSPTICSAPPPACGSFRPRKCR